MKTVKSVRVGFDKQNEMASKLILADIQRYGGEQAGLVQWARAYVERSRPTMRGPLFKATGRRAAA